MKIFLIIFVLAILFVVGSAMMMQYFTGKSASPKQKQSKTVKDSSDKK